MTSVCVETSIDVNGGLWSMNGQFDVQKTVITGRSGLPGWLGRTESHKSFAKKKIGLDVTSIRLGLQFTAERWPEKRSSKIWKKVNQI